MSKKRKSATPKSIEERVAQGNEAETLLKSPVFAEACDLLEEKYINAWISSGIGDEEKREQFLFISQGSLWSEAGNRIHD